MHYLQADLLESFVGSLVAVIKIVQIERQIILSINTNAGL